MLRLSITSYYWGCVLDVGTSRRLPASTAAALFLPVTEPNHLDTSCHEASPPPMLVFRRLGLLGMQQPFGGHTSAYPTPPRRTSLRARTSQRAIGLQPSDWPNRAPLVGFREDANVLASSSRCWTRMPAVALHVAATHSAALCVVAVHEGRTQRSGACWRILSNTFVPCMHMFGYVVYRPV